jgi:GTP-dependent phosphoenolpyruvate carboxykinase
MQSLLSVDIDQWQEEMTSIGEDLETYGDRLPEALKKVHEQVVSDLQKAS